MTPFLDMIYDMGKTGHLSIFMVYLPLMDMRVELSSYSDPLWLTYVPLSYLVLTLSYLCVAFVRFLSFKLAL